MSLRLCPSADFSEMQLSFIIFCCPLSYSLISRSLTHFLSNLSLPSLAQQRPQCGSHKMRDFMRSVASWSNKFFLALLNLLSGGLSYTNTSFPLSTTISSLQFDLIYVFFFDFFDLSGLCLFVVCVEGLALFGVFSLAIL